MAESGDKHPAFPSREEQKIGSRFLLAHLGEANRARVEYDSTGKPFIVAFTGSRDDLADTEFESLRVEWRRGNRIVPATSWLDGFHGQAAALDEPQYYLVALEQAAAFLSDEAPVDIIPPALTYGEDGSIQIEWHNPGVDLEIEFFADNAPEAYTWFHDEAESSMGELGEEMGGVRRAFQLIGRINKETVNG